MYIFVFLHLFSHISHVFKLLRNAIESVLAVSGHSLEAGLGFLVPVTPLFHL